MAKSTTRASLSKDQIVDTALALIAEIGVDQLSMRQLSAQLGASLGATYRHVSTKEELLALCGRALYQRSFRPRKTDEDPLEWLRELVINLYDLLVEHPGMAAYVVHADSVIAPEMSNEVRDSLMQIGHTAVSADMVGLVLTFYTAGALLADSETVLSEAGVPNPKAIIVAGFDFILRNYKPGEKDPTERPGRQKAVADTLVRAAAKKTAPRETPNGAQAVKSTARRDHVATKVPPKKVPVAKKALAKKAPAKAH
ncbi:MAG: putative TetR-family transcriptional regulator [Pseudonocardiales bacterium]|nr:putative TetR-family transcriptional regulator [Pseudonocardiales bacterium]